MVGQRGRGGEKQGESVRESDTKRGRGKGEQSHRRRGGA